MLRFITFVAVWSVASFGSAVAQPPDFASAPFGDGHSLDAADGGPADALFIDNVGNVGIGTSDPQNKLSVLGPWTAGPGGSQIKVHSSGPSGTVADISGLALTSEGSASEWIVYRYGAVGADRFCVGINGSTEPFCISTAGNVGIGVSAPAFPLQMKSGAHVTAGGAWMNASGRALKAQIRDLPEREALTALQALNPVTFAYKANLAETHAGFIAEDVPDLVATNDRRGLAPMDIVAVLTKVVQQQQDRIRALEERLTTLEQQD